MKITKFAALAGAALLAGSAAFAQATSDYGLPQGFTFTNEIGSDVVKGMGNGRSDKQSSGPDVKNNVYRVEFGGIYDDVTIGYKSEKIEFEVSPRFGISDKGENFWDGVNGRSSLATKNRSGLNNDDLGFSWWEVNFDVRFSPFDIVDFYLNKDEWTPGDYLPYADKHMGGNLGSSGFATVFKPLEGLRLSIGIPFDYSIHGTPNFLDAEREDRDNGANYGTDGNHVIYTTTSTADYKFRLDVGADYNVGDLFTVGVFVTDLIPRSERGYGIYGHLNMGALEANLGYTYSAASNPTTVDDWDGLVKINGHHKANAYVGFNAGDLGLGLEVLMTPNFKESLYDLYAGVKASYDVIPGKFNAALKAYTAFDFGTNKSKHLDWVAASMWGIADGAALGLQRSTYAAAADKNAVADTFGDAVYIDSGYSLYWGSTQKARKNAMQLKGAANMVGLTPSIKYNTGNNEFGAKACLEYFFNGDGAYAVKFPVYWKWTF